MSLVTDLSAIKQSTALYAGVFVFAFLAPGFLTLQVFWPHLLIEYDFWKTALLSIAITGPGFIVPFVIALIGRQVLVRKSPSHVPHFGDYSDWYVRIGINNALNYYSLTSVAYILNWNVTSFLIAVFVAVVILGILGEFLHLYQAIKNPDAILRHKL